MSGPARAGAAGGATFGLTELRAAAHERAEEEQQGDGARSAAREDGERAAPLELASGGELVLAERGGVGSGGRRPSRPGGAPREPRPGSRAAQAAARAGDGAARSAAAAEDEPEADKMDIMMLLDID
jgi:hypothetical protein